MFFPILYLAEYFLQNLFPGVITNFGKFFGVCAIEGASFGLISVKNIIESICNFILIKTFDAGNLLLERLLLTNFVWPVVSYVFLILSSQSFLGIFSPRLQIMICIPFFRWQKFSFSKVYHNFLLFLWIFEDLLSCKDLERFLL